MIDYWSKQKTILDKEQTFYILSKILSEHYFNELKYKDHIYFS